MATHMLIMNNELLPEGCFLRFKAIYFDIGAIANTHHNSFDTANLLSRGLHLRTLYAKVTTQHIFCKPQFTYHYIQKEYETQKVGQFLSKTSFRLHKS